MQAAYFWSEGEPVVTYLAPNLDNVKKQGLLNCLCVDRFRTDDDDVYGVFIKNDGWNHRPFNTFPNEFRAWLLINT